MNLINEMENITQESLLKNIAQILHISEVANKKFSIFHTDQMQATPIEDMKYLL